jgi:predicted Zn finger-like uncharacterized protein
MAEEKYTRCPACRTVYRVTDEQLALRDGRVRCGHCQVVFDGVAELVAPAAPEAFTPRDEAPSAPQAPVPQQAFTPPSERPSEAVQPPASLGPDASMQGESTQGEPIQDESTQGEPMHDQAADEPEDDASWPAASAEALAPELEPAREPAAADAVPAVAGSTAAVGPEAPAAADGSGDSSADAATEPAPAPAPHASPAPADRRAPIAFATAAVLLALLLPLQAVFHFREAVAARWPAASPLIHRACAALGCKVGAPREVTDLAIQASDLQADPAHQGLLILTATIRNRGAVPLAYPYLELTLTDAQDQVVVRRALTPAEYVGGTVDLAQGIPANSDIAVKLFIDASATTQAGYRLFLFYG